MAPELASKSYNSTKKMYYHGVKAHIVERKRPGTLPDLEILFIEEAARHDGPVFDQMRPMLHDNLVFADQAYKRADADNIERTQDLKVFTPIKKVKGQKNLIHSSVFFPMRFLECDNLLNHFLGGLIGKLILKTLV